MIARSHSANKLCIWLVISAALGVVKTTTLPAYAGRGVQAIPPTVEDNTPGR
jgi:hypothetical protein